MTTFFCQSNLRSLAVARASHNHLWDPELPYKMPGNPLSKPSMTRPIPTD